jgi:hypothetical protein
METLLILIVILVLVAAVAPGLYALRKRMIADSGQLELWRVMQRRGLSVDAAAEEPKNLALAMRRCTLCPSLDRCGEWLASEARDGLEDFCPNGRYLRTLERNG